MQIRSLLPMRQGLNYSPPRSGNALQFNQKRETAAKSDKKATSYPVNRTIISGYSCIVNVLGVIVEKRPPLFKEGPK